MTTNGLPNDVLSNLDPLALIIFIPICDLVVRSLEEYNFPGLIMTIVDLPSACTCRYPVHLSKENSLGLRHGSCIDGLGCHCAVLHLQDRPLWALRCNLRGRKPEPTCFPPECVDSKWLVSYFPKFARFL
jgi:hypothetical protein